MQHLAIQLLPGLTVQKMNEVRPLLAHLSEKKIPPGLTISGKINSALAVFFFEIGVDSVGLW